MENSPLDAGAIGFLLKSTGECEMSRKRASPSDSNDPINRWGRGGMEESSQRRSGGGGGGGGGGGNRIHRNSFVRLGSGVVTRINHTI